MDGQYVSMEVHKEFEKRMISENERLADEDKRQNKRIDALEDTVRQIGTLTASVEKLAISAFLIPRDDLHPPSDMIK